MSGSTQQGDHWPDESIWTRKLRRFRGRLGDDPSVGHLLATLHTESKTNTTGLATAAVLLSETGLPAGQPNFSSSGPANPVPEQVHGADLVLGSRRDWDPNDLRSNVEDVVDAHIEHARQNASHAWHVLYTRARADIDADWCLVYARGREHARRKLPLPEASPWSDRAGVEHIGPWPRFSTDVQDGCTWTADAAAISVDNEAPRSPPEDACEVFLNASE